MRPVVKEPGELSVPPHSPTEDGLVVGSSPALMDVFRVVARVASTPATVLIAGESGTGKSSSRAPCTRREREPRDHS